MSAMHTSKNCADKLLASYEQGFTLVELMVSLVLGLLISAAAFQLLANSAHSTRVQAAMADIQDAAVFSLTYVKKEIAMANLGSSTTMTQDSAWTGVVLTGSEVKDPTTNIRTGNLRGITGVSDDLLTLSGTNKKATGPNNVQETKNSDQLTIQYKAPFDGSDCEGNSVNQGDMVIERFFIRADNQLLSGETKANNLGLALVCDAGHYQPPANEDPNKITADSVTITGFGGTGKVLINRVDDFEIQLGVQSDNGVKYMSIDKYLEPSTSGSITGYQINVPIVAVQFAVIIRGISSVGGVSKKVYKVNGVNRTIDQSSTSYARRVYQSVVNLRNSRASL